ncbi:YhdH/YhfP family quinone oxidoreductase [Geoalkalibacter sp.]|uniref:YhdH/YhfP family quinone oxidoreductase n=1 Tax=Geoalkalibacter sp. TaxID=3041440 RepID=UPI00272E2430|nr:YhdH/YhfP family quinone oxidoreductase [Geoalkalibacter sp.]
MSATTFKALIVEEAEPKKFTRRIGERQLSDLPSGDLLIRVRYSSLNYKDALSATGNKGVTRNFPHTPGIDAAGEVVECTCGRYQPGDQVLVTGYDLGMNTPGGFGQYIRIPCEWAVRLPQGLSPRGSMILGTAGFTAGLCVYKLEQAGVVPGDGEVLVTGATGGVGSIAVGILARQGYRVTAVTGKPAAADFLKTLGAAEILSREAVLEGAERPLMKERWAGVVDVVGGDLLAAAVKATRYGGAVSCCGLVGSPDLNLNVFPFILRGVSLLGVDSVQCPLEPRLEVWGKLAGPWKPAHLEETAQVCTLEELEDRIHAILKGQLQGRALVDLG